MFGTMKNVIDILALTQQLFHRCFCQRKVRRNHFDEFKIKFIIIRFFFVGIWSFDPAVCRSLGVSYTNVQTIYNDIPVYVYELDLDEKANAKKCFCRDENTCPPKGTFDMYRCTGVSIEQ